MISSSEVSGEVNSSAPSRICEMRQNAHRSVFLMRRTWMFEPEVLAIDEASCSDCETHGPSAACPKVGRAN